MDTEIREETILREETIDLRDSLRVLSMRRWVIISIFIVTVLTVAVKTFTATPIYQAAALIVIERETGLRDYVGSGHRIDARLTTELLVSLFLPSSPLHDGGVIIHNDRIHTAGCLLPLTKNPYINKRYGTRHRAAIGLSEETDAVIVVISEETQEISLIQHGSITTISDETILLNKLEEIFIPRESQPQLWKNWFAK